MVRSEEEWGQRKTSSKASTALPRAVSILKGRLEHAHNPRRTTKGHLFRNDF